MGLEIDSNKYPFPKRLRHHTAPNLYFKLEELNEPSGYYPPVIQSMDWSQLFADGNPPKNLDVGCGKGIFLLNYAHDNPASNVLGLEIRRPAVGWINEVAKGESIANCAALWYSVVNGLHFIPDNSIDNIFYLFPDPWPKQKHVKRRAFNPEFLIEVSRILSNNGRLWLATDVDEVHKYHLKLLKRNPAFEFTEVNRDEWQLPITNKERFCLEVGLPVYRIIAGKKHD
jgi:tRNA (guanine-N7-)-methyltransferase